jgi:hypothetical protein
MLRPRLDPTTASLAARLASPLAAVLAIAVFARFQADPVAASETAYLGLALGLVLVAAAVVAPRPSIESQGGALLATAAVWALPAGPARGAVSVALAAGALAVAVVRWLPIGSARGHDDTRGHGSAHGDGGEVDDRWLPAAPLLALAFGLQALLRASELLVPGSTLRGVALFVGFPLAGAVAVLALARLHGRRRALLAGAAVVLAGPGFRPATVAALLTLAAASWLLARDPLAGDLLPALLRAPVRGLEERRRAAARLAVRLAAAAIVLAPFAWDPRTAGLCLAAGLAAGGLRWRWVAPAVAAAALGGALALPGRPLGEAAALAALVVLAVPALALPERDRAPAALAALLLALAAARALLVDGALAPAAGLAALTLPRRGAVPAVQGGWIAGLLGAGCLLAAYPWLREDPLAGALALFGLEVGWPGALVTVAALVLVVGAVAFAGRRARTAVPGRIERAASRTAGVAAFALVLAHLPVAGATPDGASGLILDANRPTWALETGDLGAAAAPGARVGSIVVDSSLANAAGLPEGAPVATLRLREPGRPDRVWTLRVGEETGEWAAGRPDLQGEPPPAPRTWSSWVAEGGGFFGRRYRAVHRLSEPAMPERVELALRPDLPQGVTLTVFHLELRP